MASKVFQVQEHVLPCQHIRQYHRATVDGEDGVLNLAIKQYTPLNNKSPKPNDLTIIGAHANGFPKELYEPLWIELLQRTEQAGIGVRGIWIADVAHQGASGVLNESKLGDDPSWFDHPRDLLHMINHFRDQIQRPIVGIGHSMGGCHLVNLSLIHPRLFASLILVDPVIQKYTTAQGNYAPARASSFRRDIWPSRAAAAQAFKKSKFYTAWDSRVLDLWIQHGLRDLPTHLHPIPDDPASPSPSQTSPLPPITTEPTLTPQPTSPPVTLTTTKHQEVFTFLRPNYAPQPTPDTPGPHLLTTTTPSQNRTTIPDLTPSPTPQSPFYRPEPTLTFTQLPHLRPPTLYIFGAQSYLSQPDARAEKLACTGVGVGGSGGAPEGKVREYVMPGVGHLVPMEKVAETAEQCGVWIVESLRGWREAEEVVLGEWDGVPRGERARLSERWLEAVSAPVAGLPAVKGKVEGKGKSNL
ncbi:alpha/beta-hydrolase [Pseudovirgaria hyperparasitica]|uniref:Alpha/beta-hydrolase n=1 Tax=Pseudovirgaria hyperparasitica TaxID=470096 RepID=A0A6A6WHV5_9PEZI|nr:alpha/beta-hydrolase [Pseudovirgaria hyperparasitica]KAF2761819.1 alpha/beta-hydrolase [Pseudovirgaria hyperparasitica]